MVTVNPKFRMGITGEHLGRAGRWLKCTCNILSLKLGPRVHEHSIFFLRFCYVLNVS